ncbi:CoA-transferase family III domain-containing protein [Penicillium atrosanguineum]|uniref:CoA-transferase family III domain-containing protein n=1 Tax=Penicillium atrosanguineum TaxID=1132637 RepID=UPI00238895AD|nr:CoA-transferase family III domain-containing protein [Penicillium atrosanguineum]KAJ5314182.1 CoA-transferase family III domain-containing protein [Penicillium atrosanguineum]
MYASLTYLEERWLTRFQILYLSIVGPLMLAAFFEWVLWLAAFVYCLVKVYQKADHWSVRVLAVVMMVLFSLLRQVISAYAFSWFGFYSFSILLIGPWLICVYRLVTNSLGRTKKIDKILDERTAPKTVVVMPVYKEEPDVLIAAINSVVDCDYPAGCIHVFLSYDGGGVDEPYLRVIQHLGIPASLQEYPRSIDVIYKSARITVSRFPHGGKRKCQKNTFKLIDKVYARYIKRHDNLFLLFIDSDCILDRVCLQNFMYDMELKPGSKHTMLAMTGIITSTTKKNNMITILQDMEYIHGQLFERSVESGCGSVTCLPGALTILRFSAFRKMAKYYFSDKAEQCDDLFDFGKCHLGEDRWLTHLFMIGATKPYEIQMCMGAFCKTEAVQTFSTLLQQRRRWFLGYITNEVCMITDIRLWKRYPLLCLFRFMQNTIRTTALLFFIMVVSLMTTSQKAADLPIAFMGVSLGLNYLLMFYFGLQLKRFKAWLYPLMFILNPFFNWAYMVYGILTAGQRTWGGPRADAATADDHTTPAEAVEQAKAQGDELNVDVNTFRTSTVSRRRSVPVRPSRTIEGQFAPAEKLLDNIDRSTNEPGPSQRPFAGPLFFPPHAFHDSAESLFSGSSDAGSNTISPPRNVESLMSEEDPRSLYCARRASATSKCSLNSDDNELYPGAIGNNEIESTPLEPVVMKSNTGDTKDF